MRHKGQGLKLRQPCLEFTRLQFEGLKKGIWHPAPWHNAMMALIGDRKITRKEIEKKFRRIFCCLPVIQPDLVESIDAILHDLMYDFFVDTDDYGRYYIFSDTPRGGISHSSIQYDYGGLIPVELDKPVESPSLNISKASADIIKYLKKSHGRTTRKKLMRALRHLKSADFNAVEKEGHVVVEKVKKEGRGRPTTLYSLKNEI